MKALLILGGSNDQLFMIKTAKKMGLVTVVIDGNINAPGLSIADHSKVLDFSNTPAVITYCQQLISDGVNLCGVLTMGSDVPQFLATIAEPFSWFAPSFDTARITTNKFLMKERFSQHNIAVPKYSLVKHKEEIVTLWQKWQCERIIIKPVDAAGSRGVSICSNAKDLETLFTHAKQNSKTAQVIIEEYIDGEQISTESVVYNGKFYHPGFADRVYGDTRHFFPYIIENGGWQPSALNAQKYQEICDLIEKVAEALDIDTGILKGDIVYSSKYKKAMIIEVASRLSGGDFSASLVPLAHDINYIKSAIQIALKDPVDLTELIPKTNYVVANRYFFLPPGRLDAINGVKQVKRMKDLKKLEFNYQVGEQIPVIRNHGQRVGVFIIRGNNYEQVQKMINDIYDTITFVIDGIECSGSPKALING